MLLPDSPGFNLRLKLLIEDEDLAIIEIIQSTDQLKTKAQLEYHVHNVGWTDGLRAGNPGM